jgi:hypothetical protein
MKLKNQFLSYGFYAYLRDTIDFFLFNQIKKMDQYKIDVIISDKINICNTLIKQKWSQIYKDLFKNPPYNTHENEIYIENIDSAPLLRIQIVDKNNLIDNCSIAAVPNFGYNDSQWNLHTHPDTCINQNMVLCHEHYGNCGTINPGLPSDTDMITTIKASLFFSSKNQTYTPVVAGVINKYGIIWTWPTKEFILQLSSLIQEISTWNVDDDEEKRNIFNEMIHDMFTFDYMHKMFRFMSNPQNHYENPNKLIQNLLNALKQFSFPIKQVKNMQELQQASQTDSFEYNFYGDPEKQPIWAQQQFCWSFCPLQPQK